MEFLSFFCLEFQVGMDELVMQGEAIQHILLPCPHFSKKGHSLTSDK